MALVRSKMSLMASGAYGKIWNYETPDAKATVVAADYFLAMTADLNPGDHIHVRAVVGGTEVHFGMSILVSNGTTVTSLSGASLA